jgi:hypothetical protein
VGADVGKTRRDRRWWQGKAQSRCR